MEGAQNEGDEIILSALRGINCASIGADITSVRALTPDMIVEAVSRSLFLISDGEVKFPKTLPSNIASRHRICTTMATKVKDIGFPQNLGYNQLLYPTEATTKDLIFWLVQKLPRMEEDVIGDAMGANAMLNKRITESLDKWIKSTWKLHFCTSGMPPRNIHGIRPLRTVFSAITGSSNSNNEESNAASDVRNVFHQSSIGNYAAESTLYEQHTHEILAGKCIFVMTAM